MSSRKRSGCFSRFPFKMISAENVGAIGLFLIRTNLLSCGREFTSAVLPQAYCTSVPCSEFCVVAEVNKTKI